MGRDKRFMKIKNTAAVLKSVELIILLILFSFFSVSCSGYKTRKELAQRLAEQENTAENSARIKELQSQIKSVEKQVETTIEAVRKKGTYWRLLALKYMDYKMWGEALNAFDQAILVYSENAVLQYNRGLCAAQMGRASIDNYEKEKYFQMAEAGYQNAIKYDSKYTSPMYALAVLYDFEFSEPVKALPYILDYTDIERSDINGKFLLARIYLETGQPDNALKIYEDIIKKAKNKTDIQKAKDFYSRVSGGDYGN